MKAIDLENRIRVFCTERNITVTQFGIDALGNPSFVTRLKGGADPKLSTVNKVLWYMSAYDEKEAGK